MNQLRIHGDPFGEDAAASLLRSFLRLSLGNGMRAALSLAAVRPRPAAADEREIPLTDGVRDLRVGSRLPPAEIELLLRAAAEAAPATAPVVVFAPEAQRVDAAREAGLQWPTATVVLTARDGMTAADLLERVRAELRWAGQEHPVHALEERELQPWLALPAPAAEGPLVLVGGPEFAAGGDQVLTLWRSHLAPQGVRLRWVVPTGAAADAEALLATCGIARAQVDLLVAAFEPGHARDAVAIVLPCRRLGSSRELVQALASGRPVCVSRFAATAALVGRAGVCVPIGGRNLPDEAEHDAHFAPHPQALLAALRQVLGDSAAGAAIGRRAREHVIETLLRGRPAAPPPPVHPIRSNRPLVVLEAPWFETSSSAELSLATARALLQRGRVDLRLVPTGPQRHGLATFRARTPELEPLLARDPGVADLWLSAGWPVRSVRPACRSWALRIDQEFGTLPHELTPHVTQDADAVVVHSEHVYRTVTAAGRPMASVRVVPHGVDAAMHEQAQPDAELLAWKGDLPAVLFCGGMIWRKGFDLFLRAVLQAHQAGARFCVVVKSIGHDQHYGRFHLGNLVERFLRTPGTPPLRVVDAELTRDQLASLYTACDVLLHPYRGEGFCLPVLEARACGLPVLATAGGATDPLLVGPGATPLPSCRREVELPTAHVGTPWVLEPSPEATAAALVTALAELPARQAAARGFASSVRAAYTWDAAAASLETLAFAAMGRRRVVPAPVAIEPVVTVPQPEPLLPAVRAAIGVVR